MTKISHEATVEIEGEKWKPMSPEEVEAAIAAEPCNTRMRRYHSCQKYYKRELEKDRFPSVIWLDIPRTNLIIPEGSRTIRDVAKKMVSEGHTFQSLVEDCRSWFVECCEIDSDFKYCKFGTIWLRGATDFERNQSSSGKGKYHIHHGAHRSLVLGKRLLEGKEYESVKAILIKTTGAREPDKICD